MAASVIQCNKAVTIDDPAVAVVGEKKLTRSELGKIVPKDLYSEDSATMADNYVRKWVKQELMVQKANENLSFEQKDLTKEIEEYRNSLIIYKYKNELMSQQMDTVVTKNQVAQYFNANSENFKLNNNIVKAIFLKIPADLANPKQLREMVDDTTPEGMNILREYCLQYAKAFDFFDDNWVNFDIVNNNLPVGIEDSRKFLERNNLIEQKDASFYYLVSIQNYKFQNDLAPLEYVENNIKNLILNKRKIEFLKQVEENVYKEGVRQNKFKIYKETAK